MAMLAMLGGAVKGHGKGQRSSDRLSAAGVVAHENEGHAARLVSAIALCVVRSTLDEAAAGLEKDQALALDSCLRVLDRSNRHLRLKAPGPHEASRSHLHRAALEAPTNARFLILMAPVDTWGYVNIFSVDSAGRLPENARRRWISRAEVRG
jgi:hypothetical protein